MAIELTAFSDPYLIIKRAIDEKGKEFSPIHKTEKILKTLDPVWNPFVLSLSRLCNNDPKWPIIIECYDWDQSGSDDLIGMVKVRLYWIRHSVNTL